MNVTTKISGDEWMAMADIPWDYFPPKVILAKILVHHVTISPTSK